MVLNLSDRPLGLIIALVGNTLIAFSLTLQKFAHHNHRHHRPHPYRESSNNNDYLTKPSWHLGIVLMAFGEILNFVALSYCPAALVTPLGSWSVVLASLLAWGFLGETVEKRGWIGVVGCVVGGILMALGVPDSGGAYTGGFGTKTWIGAIGILVGVGWLIGLGFWEKGRIAKRYVGIYVGISSLLGAVSIVCAKYLSVFLRIMLGLLSHDDQKHGAYNIFKRLAHGQQLKSLLFPLLVTLILMITVLTQLYYLNLAMSHFGNAQVVPIYYVMFTFCAIVGSAVVYGELDRFTGKNLPFVAGVISTMIGVVLVSKREKGGRLDPEEGMRENGQSQSKEYERVNCDEEAAL